MARNNLERYAQNAQNDFLLEEGKEIWKTIKGNWRTQYFKNDNPLVLELGCGYGEYTMGLSEHFLDKNFIGTDLKGSRLYKGANDARDAGRTNVAFLRTRIELIQDFFAEGEVDEIWITFPDPQPKDKQEKHRLTNKKFLELYKGILKKDGVINFKTDNRPLFDYTLEVLEELGIKPEIVTFDIYKEPELLAEHKGIQTRYEKKFRAEGFTINYMRFRF